MKMMFGFGAAARRQFGRAKSAVRHRQGKRMGEVLGGRKTKTPRREAGEAGEGSRGDDHPLPGGGSPMMTMCEIWGSLSPRTSTISASPSLALPFFGRGIGLGGGPLFFSRVAWGYLSVG